MIGDSISTSKPLKHIKSVVFEGNQAHRVDIQAHNGRSIPATRLTVEQAERKQLA